MLNAKGFRFIYENGMLPIDKSYHYHELIKNQPFSNKVSQEWDSIESKLDAMAESLLKNGFQTKSYPPCFYINIKCKENVSRLNDAGFKISRCNVIFIFDSTPYCLEF